MPPSSFGEYIHSCCEPLHIMAHCAILTNHNINVVLIFTGKTFEYIVGSTRCSKASGQILREALGKGDEKGFWDYMDKHNLRTQIDLPDLKHRCTATKFMDTRAKGWWPVRDGDEIHSAFSSILEYGLQYAAKVG